MAEDHFPPPRRMGEKSADEWYAERRAIQAEMESRCSRCGKHVPAGESGVHTCAPDPKPDLVARLREEQAELLPLDEGWLPGEAADEIERLRKLRAECRACRLTDDALGEDTDHAT